MSLKLKYIAPYLPYSVKADLSYYAEDQEINHAIISGADKDNIIVEYGWAPTYGRKLIQEYSISKIKLLLRDLSQLTREITHNGQTFIPLLELAATAGTCSTSDWHIENDTACHNIAKGCYFKIGMDNSFIFKNSDKWKDFGVPAQQFRLFNLLFEWHFDLYGLIGKGLAINLQ